MSSPISVSTYVEEHGVSSGTFPLTTTLPSMTSQHKERTNKRISCTLMYSHVLYIPMYSHTILYITMSSHVLLYPSIYSHVLHTPMYSCIFPCPPVYSHVLSCIPMYSHVLLCTLPHPIPLPAPTPTTRVGTCQV